MQLSITFSLIRCACSAERQAGRRCPSCKREPEEIDEDLERRRTIVAGARAREPVTVAEALALEEAFAVVGDWFDGFSASYEATADGSVEDAARRLRDSLEELDLLHARAARARRLRPNHAIWVALDGVLAAYDDVRDEFLDALIAPTVEDAEGAAARGQQAIDAASAALDRFNTFVDAWQSVHDADLASEHGDLLAGAEAIVALRGTTDMVELDRKGADLFARITRGDIDCPSGFGLRIHLLDLAVEGSMDPARFWSTARAVYQLLAKHEVVLRGLFADANWRRDLTALSLETRDAGFEAAAVAAAGANRRRLVQLALRLAARQIERGARPLLATLLAVHLRQPYASERRRDINALLTRAVHAGLEGLLAGLDPKLRDADAHGEFVVEEDGVRLTGSRRELDYLTDDELVDVTLAGTESIVALYWGLVAALVAAGVDTDALDQAVAIEIADADRIKFILLLNGWHDIEVTINDADAVARGRREEPNAWGLIAAVVAVLPDDCATLTLVATCKSGKHTVSGPLAPFRLWSGGDEEQEKEIAFMLASMAWTVDGAPILTRAHTEKVYAYRAVEALNPAVPVANALKNLRALLDASQAIGSSDLAATIAAALRLRREVATGMPPTKSADAVVDAFDRWLLVDVPEMRSSW